MNTIKLSTLKPNGRNPRKIKSDALKKLCESIERDPQFMELRPIVIGEDCMILGGNQRFRACQQLGMKEVPVSWVKTAIGLTDEQRRRFILVDNAPEGMAGEWDLEILTTEWRMPELGDFGFDLDSILADLNVDLPTNEDVDAESQIDRSEELRKEWNVETGQLWQLGEHRLLCGDSTKAEDVVRLFGEDRATIIVTDPPYGVSYAAKNEFLNAIARGNRIQTPIEGDHQTPDEMSAFWIAAFTAIREVLVSGASYYVTGPQGGDLLLLLQLALRQSGFPLRHMLVWVKNNHVLGRCDYHFKHEPILYGWVDGSHKFYGDSSQFSTWEIDRPHKSDLHPTMKPVELYVRALSNSSKAGDVVAEPFCGSGTSLIACEQLGRKCRAIEISPGYVAVAMQRFKDATGKQPVLVREEA
jgi:site-specific DNA-methyltransferase (adenine-specific)